MILITLPFIIAISIFIWGATKSIYQIDIDHWKRRYEQEKDNAEFWKIMSEKENERYNELKETIRKNSLKRKM